MARRVERGDIWMYRFARPDRRRPVLVMSRPAALTYLRTALVAPITTTVHGVASEIVVGLDEGLKRRCAVNFDHLITVPQAELRTYVGHVRDDMLASACRAVATALGCR